MSILEVIEGLRYQGVDEAVPYSIDTTPWGGSPSNVSVVVYDEADMSDVTGVVMSPNSPGVSNNKITLSLLDSLTLDHTYRIEVKSTIGSGTLECHIRVKCIR